jgi:Transposase, Mutator family
VEEAVTEMYLCGISVRKIAGVTEALSEVIVGKDVVRRIAPLLEEEQRARCERSSAARSTLSLVEVTVRLIAGNCSETVAIFSK